NVIDALNDIEWGAKTMVVRVNGLDTPWGYRDIVDVAERCLRLDLIMLPKAGGARDIEFVDTLLSGIESAKQRKRRIGVSALIETALGMVNIREIATASDRLEALIFGIGDFVASMQTPDLTVGSFSPEYAVLTNPDATGDRHRYYNDKWHYAMMRVATVCRAYGIRPIDGPYADFKDVEGYRAAAQRARALVFDGKWAIHPSQITIANEVFSPLPQQVDWAKRAVSLVNAAIAEGDGAVGVDGELFDLAHLKIAENIMRKVTAITHKSADTKTSP